MKQKLVVWGASGYAVLIASIVRSAGEYEVAGFLDDNSERHGAEFCGAFVLGGREQLDNIRRLGIHHLIFGFGDCRARLRLAELARSKGFSLATAIHPHASIADGAALGAGVVVGAGAVIDPDVTIEDNVLINPLALVGHGCTIEEGAYIAPGALLTGGVSVGRGAWIGVGAVVKQLVRIGRGSVIGAGAVVVSDIPDGVVAYGVPARVMREVWEAEQSDVPG